MMKRIRQRRKTPALAATNHRGSFNRKQLEGSTMAPQESRVLERLKQGPLTKLRALNELGILILAQCIYRLKNLGYEIETRRVEHTNEAGSTSWYAKYVLVNKEVQNV